MKWYKHMSDSADDPDIDDAISIFGFEAYYVFFRTLEVMSREFDVNSPAKNIFSIEFLRKKYRTSWKKTVKILEFFTERKRIFFGDSEGQRLPSVSLHCPKLKQLTDEYARKHMKKKSGQTPDLSPDIDQTIEVEGEEEGEEEEVKTPTTDSKFDGLNLKEKMEDNTLRFWGTLKYGIVFDRKRNIFIGVTEQNLSMWEEACPAVDIRAEIKNARNWIFENKGKGKKANYVSFLGGWFRRCQQRGGTRKVMKGDNITSTDKPPTMYELKSKLEILQEEWDGQKTNDEWRKGIEAQNLKARITGVKAKIRDFK